MLYELATGKPPFSASGLNELIHEIIHAEVKKVDNFSDTFHDLLSKLLEKDPLRRISWEQLRKHPFWESEIFQRTLPKQPQFDKYIQVRGYDPDEFYEKQEKNSYFVPKIISDPNEKSGDILRMSLNV